MKMEQEKKCVKPIKPLFRIVACILSILLIPLGIWGTIANVSYPPLKINTDIMIGLIGLFWGIVLLIIAIKGKLTKEEIL